ncbi:MAG: hypothetical protein RIK87_21220 [Fuerstiella sp.]
MATRNSFSDSADEANPYRAPKVAAEPSRPRFGPRDASSWLRLGAVLQAIATVAAVVAAFVDIESIVFSGPVASVIGWFVAINGLKCRRPAATAFGLSATAMTIVTFLLINFMGWSPSDAQGPLPPLIVWYALIALPLGFFGVFGRPSTKQPTP